MIRRRNWNTIPASPKNQALGSSTPAGLTASRAMPVHLKSPEEIEKMRVAGRLAAEVLDYIGPHVKAGRDHRANSTACATTTSSTCRARRRRRSTMPRPAISRIRSRSARRSITWCATASPARRSSKPGDIVNIDITVIKDGFHGDTSRMFYVGQPSIQARRLCDITYECMWLGIEAVRAGRLPGRHRPRHPDARGAQRVQRRARILRPRHRAPIS